MVGAVLVHNNQIIGEGWHQVYGGPHAEVECIQSVAPASKHLIPHATMYVSLEPCAHWGKTPPCADMLIRENIKTVVVGCRDPFPLVSGKGIEKLQAAGVAVSVGVLEEACLELNKYFFLFHTRHRPHVTLKWAQTADGKISGVDAAQRLIISGPQAGRLVHRWRSESAAILVGTNTALTDNPELTTRLWPGPSPLRLVVDLHGRLPAHLHLFDGAITTIVFSLHRHTVPDAKELGSAKGVYYYRVTADTSLVRQILNALHTLGVQSLFMEGGSRMLQSFIDEDLWDEARIITNEALIVGGGVQAPVLHNHKLSGITRFGADAVRFFTHQ